jgi:catechol 2,3-dioxygenase-like lactoylglutathione lyase family enzyme
VVLADTERDAMPIRELFHFMQIVDDFDAAQSFYDSLLTPQTYMPKSWSDFDKRWASLGVVGPDFVLEIMEPSALPEDQNLPLPKFHNRHGQHWHSFSWYVDAADMPALIERLRGYGVRVLTPYPSEEAVPRTIFTHPKDTFGQLELQAFEGDGRWDPRFSEGVSTEPWASGPLGLLRASHLTTGVSDLERARDFYTTCLEAEVFHTSSGPDRDSVFALVGNETVVELARPKTEDSLLGRDIAEHGELPHAATFTVADIDAATRHLEELGLRVNRSDDETIVLDPAQALGAVIAFTAARIPNDPRD